tara:strand:+ start:5152 stop:6300 length:1149 start_codon:yes stop_codon:yes gene_type:complete
MIEVLVIIILLLIIIIYITLHSNKPNNQPDIYSAEYFRGLNYLLNNEDDKALKIFTDLIDIDSSTIETHLALGGVYRRRGEFDKAILIHQNLLSRPKLDKSIKNQSLYELAKDFFSAGLYDKSEKILINLKDNKNYEDSCIEYILLIYEISKDWDSAINFSKTIKQDIIRNLPINIILSQYYCEKANEYQNDNQLNKSITVLKKAIDVNPRCSRAYSMLFKLNISSDTNLALNYLVNLIEIEPSFLLIMSKDILELSASSHDENIDSRIEKIILEYSTPEEFSPELYEFMFNLNDSESPNKYIEKTKKNSFATIYDKLYGNKNDESEIYFELLSMIKNNFTTYSCSNCGYSPKSYIWLCPSCNHWQSILPITISEQVQVNER